MKKIFLPLALAICIFLSACGSNNTNNQETDLPDTETGTNQPDVPVDPAQPESPDEPQGPIDLGMLTVEVVLEWDKADELLSQLNDLSQELDQALKSQGYDAESITVTVSTAGGTTADALAAGGVDVALLPAADYLSCEDSATGILMTGEDVPSNIVAVTNAKPEWDEAFREALSAALTETGEKGNFLTICDPSGVYGAFDATALQPLREQLASEGVHNPQEE